MPAKWQRWMPFDIDAFRGSPSVQAMHPAARAGYLYLLADSWQTDDCTIPSDPIDLADKSGLGDELWAIHGPRILRKFEPIADGDCDGDRDGDRGVQLRNASLYRRWLKAKEIYESRQKAADRTNKARSPQQDDAVTGREPLRSADTQTETLTETVIQEQKVSPPAPLELFPKPAPVEYPEWLPLPDWNNYREMRKKTKKPMTKEAERLAIRKLDELRSNGQSPAAVLEQSIFNSWQGLFPLKDQPATGGRANGNPTSSDADLIAQANKQLAQFA